MALREVWFEVVDGQGNVVSSPDCVDVIGQVFRFRDAVKGKLNDSLLKGIAALQLRVYKNREAYDDPNQEPLQANATIGENGTTMETALVVEMPTRTRAREESKEEREPLKRHKTSTRTKWEWKEEEPVYCLEKDKLFFVDRDLATEQLLQCHKRKYYRGDDAGSKWLIPLVDHVFGLGKSAFGGEYIRRCRQKWEQLPDNSKRAGSFLDVIRRCHTIKIQFSPSDLLENGQFEATKAEVSFVALLHDFFDREYGIRPGGLDLAPENLPPHRSLTTTLRSLVNEIGPLFFVIDEIGTPFMNVTPDCDFARRDQFMKFCTNILFPLLPVRDLFFLIAGASFLNYVGLRPEIKSPLIDSPVDFQRLSLHLLRPSPIKDIMEHTYLDEAQTETIKDHCKLDDKQATDVAEHLFKTTFGHPRSLLDAFKSCKSYSALVEYTAPDVPDANIDRQNFGRRLRHFEEPLQELMDYVVKQEPMNLSMIWKDKGGKSSTFDSIANSFGIAWAGTVDNATLYMPSYIQHVLLASLYPLKKMLSEVVPAIGKLSIDYPDMFELLFLARFQELFHEERCPVSALPLFFNDSQEFGRCTGVRFANSAYWMPKVTKRMLTTTTAHAGSVIADIDQLILDEERVNLKPHSMSASPDILLVTKIADRTLTVGLTVKNYLRTEVKKKTVKDECFKFNRMFKSKEGRLNVLILCATVYSAELQEMFNAESGAASKSAIYPSGEFQQIHEVILLNLAPREDRAEFFGRLFITTDLDLVVLYRY